MSKQTATTFFRANPRLSCCGMMYKPACTSVFFFWVRRLLLDLAHRLPQVQGKDAEKAQQVTDSAHIGR